MEPTTVDVLQPHCSRTSTAVAAAAPMVDLALNVRTLNNPDKELMKL
jgi:hypothetical protein